MTMFFLGLFVLVVGGPVAVLLIAARAASMAARYEHGWPNK